jgi:hypothetical protein
VSFGAFYPEANGLPSVPAQPSQLTGGNEFDVLRRWQEAGRFAK